MNKKHKSLLAGGLGALASVVWVPQLLGGADSPPASPELPAESAEEAGEAAHAPESAESSSADSIPDSSPSRLSELESSLGLLVEDEDEPGWATLFQRLKADEGEPGAPAGRSESETFAGDARARLELFAEQNPLTGLIHGPDRSAGLLGHRVVRPGDTLLGGSITVLAIGAGWIELESGAARLVVELPAFRARGASGPSATPAQPAPAAAPEPPSAPDVPRERGA